MNRMCSDGGESSATRHIAAAPEAVGDHESGLSDRLALAASPAFAIMALLCIVQGSGAAAMICSVDPLSPLTGMTTMYLLMSVFHVGPWLKRIRAASWRLSRWRSQPNGIARPNGLTDGAGSR